jgi:hypothetical protein
MVLVVIAATYPNASVVKVVILWTHKNVVIVEMAAGAATLRDVSDVKADIS